MTKLKKYSIMLIFIAAGFVAGLFFVLSCDKGEKAEALPSCSRYQVAVVEFDYEQNDTSNPVTVPDGWTPLNVYYIGYPEFIAVARCAP